jgi:hypothetical protein
MASKIADRESLPSTRSPPQHVAPSMAPVCRASSPDAEAPCSRTPPTPRPTPTLSADDQAAARRRGFRSSERIQTSLTAGHPNAACPRRSRRSRGSRAGLDRIVERRVSGTSLPGGLPFRINWLSLTTAPVRVSLPRFGSRSRPGEYIFSERPSELAGAFFVGKATSMPTVSEAQRRAMQAAAHGHSTLGIPKSVGKSSSAPTRSRPRAWPPASFTWMARATCCSCADRRKRRTTPGTGTCLAARARRARIRRRLPSAKRPRKPATKRRGAAASCCARCARLAASTSTPSRSRSTSGSGPDQPGARGRRLVSHG